MRTSFKKELICLLAICCATGAIRASKHIISYDLYFFTDEKGTLKPTGVKLKNLYAEMKKPLPTKFTLKKTELAS